MRKYFALVLTFLTLINFCACGVEDKISTEPNADNNSLDLNYDITATENDDSIVKDDYNFNSLKERIDAKNVTGVGEYSEGVMFVEVKIDNSYQADYYRWYCVDKNGYIVFELPVNASAERATFHSGYAFVLAKDNFGNMRTAVVNKKGIITYPSSVGATDFHGPNDIFDSGYILATVEEYGKKSKLGVVDTNFEWVVSPSQDLYDKLSSGLIYNTMGLEFVLGDYIYTWNRLLCMNLKTGETKAVNSINPPSDIWEFYSTGYGYQIGLDYNMCNEFEHRAYRGSSFNDGVASVIYYDDTSDKYYITMIDEKGNQLFDLIETIGPGTEIAMAVCSSGVVYAYGDTLITIDCNGNQIASSDIPVDSWNISHLSYNDGVVAIDSLQWGGCYDINLNLLLE